MSLCGKGTVCKWAELRVSRFLLVWHLISSRDHVLMTFSIEAFAVVSCEACVTYSCGFQKLSRKKMSEGRLVFGFPSPFPAVRHPLCFFRSKNFWRSW